MTSQETHNGLHAFENLFLEYLHPTLGFGDIQPIDPVWKRIFLHEVHPNARPILGCLKPWKVWKSPPTLKVIVSSL